MYAYKRSDLFLMIYCYYTTILAYNTCGNTNILVISLNISHDCVHRIHYDRVKLYGPVGEQYLARIHS